MKISLATEKDAEEISQLIIKTLKESNKSDYTEEQFSFMLSRNTPIRLADKIKKGNFICMKEKNKIVGVSFLNGASIERLYVLPEYSGKGIGKKLLEETLKIAKNLKLDHVELLSSKSAIPFYEKHGFTLLESKPIQTKHRIVLPYNKMEKKL